MRIRRALHVLLEVNRDLADWLTEARERFGEEAPYGIVTLEQFEARRASSVSYIEVRVARRLSAASDSEEAGRVREYLGKYLRIYDGKDAPGSAGAVDPSASGGIPAERPGNRGPYHAR